MTTPLLQAQNFCKRFNGISVVRDVSFSLEQGAILSLLGPSGSGKTTLLRLLAGLETPDSGKLYFAGTDMTTVAPHKRNFGMMFQEYALFPHKTVEENIGFGLEMMKTGRQEQTKRIREMLALVGLEEKGTRRIDELSGGERQRVALARSLAPRPRLLLLDEPLGSLDRVLRDRLAGEIRTILKRRNVTAVFVTHDQSEAFAVADYIAVLQEGELRQFARPEQLYRRPVDGSVAAFLGFRNLVDCARLPLKQLFSPIPEHLVGYTGLLLLRPEGARLAGPRANPQELTQLTGVIRERTFQGQTYSLLIARDELELRFDLPIDPAPPTEGNSVQLLINPGAMVKLESR